VKGVCRFRQSGRVRGVKNYNVSGSLVMYFMTQNAMVTCSMPNQSQKDRTLTSKYWHFGGRIGR